MHSFGRYVPIYLFPSACRNHECRAVLCPREPLPGARRLCSRRIVAIAVFIPEPLLPPPHIDDALPLSARPDIPRSIRACMPDDSRERRAASGVLQDTWLVLHV